MCVSAVLFALALVGCAFHAAWACLLDGLILIGNFVGCSFWGRGDEADPKEFLLVVVPCPGEGASCPGEGAS